MESTKIHQHKSIFEKNCEYKHELDNLIILEFIDRHIKEFEYRDDLNTITSLNKSEIFIEDDIVKIFEIYKKLSNRCNELIKKYTNNKLNSYFLILFQEMLISTIDEENIARDSVDGAVINKLIERFKSISKNIDSSNLMAIRIKSIIKGYIKNKLEFGSQILLNLLLNTFINLLDDLL